MSKFVLTNVRLLIGGADLSGDANEVTISAKRESKDVTNFNSAGWHEFIAGLGQADVAAKGFWEAGSLSLPDDQHWGGLGGVFGVTVCPQGAADQAVAYLTNVLEGQYTLLGKVGDVAPFDVALASSWPLVRGVIAAPPANAITVTGTGTGNNLGAVSASQQIYADLHVISVAGTTPSATFSVQSATSGAFSSPTTRVTFTAATAIGGQILRAPGPITDTWWRAAWTVSGTTPSFLAAMSFGIA